jgi:phenylacetate-CoA ligase
MSIAGRAGHMLRIKGTAVFPQQIEEILMQEPEITNYALEAFKDKNDCDALKIMVGLKEPDDKVLERIKLNLKAKIRVTPAIEVLAPQEIIKILYRHGSRKPQKFFDLRPGALSNV